MGIGFQSKDGISFLDSKSTEVAFEVATVRRYSVISEALKRTGIDISVPVDVAFTFFGHCGNR